MANGSGYVLEHRLVVAAAVGRMLSSDEHVHHRDLNSLNNAPENLLIVSPSQHSRIHRFIDQRGMRPDDAVRAVCGEAAA